MAGGRLAGNSLAGWLLAFAMDNVFVHDEVGLVLLRYGPVPASFQIMAPPPLRSTVPCRRHFFLVISRMQSPGPRLARLVRESLIENEGLLPLLEVVLAELHAVGVGDVQLWFVQLPPLCFEYLLAFVGGARNFMSATAKLPRSSRTATAFL